MTRRKEGMAWYMTRRSDHTDCPPGAERCVEEAYRRGFQHGMAAADEIVNKYDRPDLLHKGAHEVAATIRYDNKGHDVSYLEVFLAMLGLGDQGWLKR